MLVAADGGADVALGFGLLPDAVIGDFDSISEAARRAIPANRQHPIPEQDTTDFDKCLRNIAAPFVVAVGFTGARIDHALAVFNTLVRHSHRRCVILGPQDVCFVCSPVLTLDLPPGTRLSLFPMGRVRGTSDGLRWPIAGLDFAPDARVGTSNEAVGGPVQLSFDAAAMLVILPADFLDAAIAALCPPAAQPAVPGK